MLALLLTRLDGTNTADIDRDSPKTGAAVSLRANLSLRVPQFEEIDLRRPTKSSNSFLVLRTLSIPPGNRVEVVSHFRNEYLGACGRMGSFRP